MYINHSSKTFLVTTTTSAPFAVKYKHYFFELTLLCVDKAGWVYILPDTTTSPAFFGSGKQNTFWAR